MSETFIKIDSLQHFEISSQTYPTNGSKILWKTVSKHLNRVLNLFSQMSYNFVYLDPVPGKQTNSKGMRYFGPKVSLTDECVFTVRTLLFVSVLQYSEGYTQFFWCQKKMTVWMELAPMLMSCWREVLTFSSSKVFEMSGISPQIWGSSKPSRTTGH